MKVPTTIRVRARSMRHEPTRAEDRVWKWLRSRRFAGVKFRRQHPIAGAILDFYAADLRLAIELDGSQHATPWGAEADGKRALRLREAGIEILRIPNELLIRDAESVWAWLEAKIEERKRELGLR